MKLTHSGVGTWLASAVLAITLSSCGDDDGNGGLVQCKALCSAQVEDGCSIVDVATCQQFCDAFLQAPSDCRTAIEASSACQNDATPCDSTGCESEVAAVDSACSQQ